MAMRLDENNLSLPDLYEKLTASGLVTRLLELARDEDLGTGGHVGDLTCQVMMEPSQTTKALLRARADLVVSGLAVVPEAVRILSPDVECVFKAKDGDHVNKGDTLIAISGPSKQVLTLERTILNTIGRLSGIATRTRAFLERITAEAGKDCKAKLLDTRKTTPGLRVLEKYAVRCGGGYCHRLGLHDAVLVKDNHIAGMTPTQVAERVGTAIERAEELRGKGMEIKFFEVEVDDLQQFGALLTLPQGGIDFVLLDNMGPDKLREAVKMRDAAGSSILLEASGGVSLETIGAIAQAGVDRISVGGLTHQAVNIDVGLDSG
uniref:Nicotinate-nucleotide pyrophosphorylase [carboxylating] n=1 Tax=Hemiselmis tepida TaxID=464990 RepID=A0A7S0W485_9CRYP|mmetsp:Transcript_27512/g.69779  ORF Transcript_27512/g.69779 Transcript_27512/m.69779 type:complete len:320 (+) Transcript_27512:111-1070(+)